MTSKSEQLDSLKEQRDALQRQIDDIEAENHDFLEFVELIRIRATQLSMPFIDVALSICPELAGDGEPNQKRPLYRYKHALTGEVIECRSGNLKALREWRMQYGFTRVESWRIP